MTIRIILFCMLFFCINTTNTLAQKDSRARQVLDYTATIFKNQRAVEMSFQIQLFSNGKLQGENQGVITLKGNKFLLKTPSVITWFNGITQWSYLTDSEEVNISNPTQAELQNINPYAFLQLYKQGYHYKLGNRQTYKNKTIQEVCLHAEHKQQEIQEIIMYTDKKSYQPLYIKITDKNKNSNEISILSLKKDLNLPDNWFDFDSTKYPNAEIIDLR